MSLANEPAFPFTPTEGAQEFFKNFPGMTYRQWLAAQIYVQLVATDKHQSRKMLAIEADKAAMALIEVLGAEK